MANTNEERWRLAHRAERDLSTYLGREDSTFPNIAHFLAQYRTACENVILQDFEFAIGKSAENRLWDAHGKINNRFRKELKHVCLSFSASYQSPSTLMPLVVPRDCGKEKSGRRTQARQTLS